MSGEDRAARKTAATCFDRNIAVEAGAGTGKTSLLVERTLNVIGSGHAGINELAAITFTQKAAGEMRERLADGLERLARLTLETAADRDEGNAADRALGYLCGDAGLPAAKIRERALEALGRLNRTTVDTIHGFCAGILHEHPIEAGVDPAFDVDQGEQFEAVLDEVWEEFVTRELGAGGTREKLWSDLLERFSLNRLTQAGRALASFGIPAELLRPPFAAADLKTLFGDRIAGVCAEIRDVLERQEGMTDLNVERLEGVKKALEVGVTGGVDAFQRLLASDPRLEGAIQKKRHPTAGKRTKNVSVEEVERVGKEAFAIARLLLGTDDTLMQKVVEALGPFALVAREELLRRGYVGFDGLLVLTRDLLRDHAAIRESLKRRFKMLLVDEFQDTDPLQYEIVLLIAEVAGGGASDPLAAELAPGKLFIVGDPKQSIYRFRGADYTAYQRAVVRLVDQGGDKVLLTTNYRSVPGVLAPVNRLFDGSAGGSWETSDYQPEYEEIVAHRTSPGNEPGVEIWTLDAPDGLGAGARRVGEARIIAREIERLANGGGHAYGDFMILLRAFSNLGTYLRPLRARNIPFVVDGGREFLKRPEVGHVIAVLRALAQPSDQISLLAFLRSPAAGVPDTELASYADAGGRWDWRQETDGHRWPALDRAFRLLREIRDRTRDLPADRLVEHVLDRTGLLVISAAAFEGAQRVANLRKLAAAAGELARDGRLSLLEVIDALEEERTADIESDSPLADEGMDAVRVLTIHKAKGLESKIVIVPDLARRDAQPGQTGWPGSIFTAAAVLLPEEGQGPGPERTAHRRALALRSMQLYNLAGSYRHEQERLHDKAEEVRVLYVALTRARERLVVVAGDPSGRAEWIKALAPWGYDRNARPDDGTLLDGGGVLLRRIPPTRAGREEEIEPQQGSPGPVEAYGRAWSRLREETKRVLRRPSGEREEDGVRSDASVFSGGPPGDLARVTGSVIHRLLELWDRNDREEMRKLVPPAARSAAERSGVDPGALEREVAETIEGFLASPLAERLQQIDLVGREVAMLRRDDDGVTWVGSVDLLYRGDDERIVVADYKTDRSNDEGELARLYSEQLRVYAEAVREAHALDYSPRRELWLLRPGRVLEL